MKVLLINPPGSFNTKELIPPLGLGYIAAVLEKNAEKLTRFFPSSKHPDEPRMTSE